MDGGSWPLLSPPPLPTPLPRTPLSAPALGPGEPRRRSPPKPILRAGPAAAAPDPQPPRPSHVAHMEDYHKPDQQTLQALKDTANRLRISSIKATTAAGSG